MKITPILAALLALSFSALPAAPVSAAEEASSSSASASLKKESSVKLQPTQSETEGSVTVGGKRIEYKAIAGTLVLKDAKGEGTASLFYTAYFKKGEDTNKRPVTFLYNGGPGSATMWLHMGSFGPKRVASNGDKAIGGAPFELVENEYSLLDASDLVFIDAPGTGFSTFADKEKGAKEYFGVDPDAHAFAQFIESFITRYGRWNSPKYLFGESYGTPRSAMVANILINERSIGLNGVILLSQILNMTGLRPNVTPGVDLAYQNLLPSFAAVAWYHKVLDKQPAELKPFLKEVEQFAIGDYAQALAQGTALSDERKHEIALRIHAYTGLPVDYIERANLRIDAGHFGQELLINRGLITGRLDARFSGPPMDPLSASWEYDPFSASVQSAYAALFNDYVRKQLKFGQDQTYAISAEGANASWVMEHRMPGGGQGGPGRPVPGYPNTLPDLAAAMKKNPQLQVMLNSGYYDLATPYFSADFEMRHLPIPSALARNIETHYYETGHMVYVLTPALKALHDNTAAFIARTSAIKQP
ncbi:MAG TPA: peptidase S10 [Burkholderiaceae bacterium]